MDKGVVSNYDFAIQSADSLISIGYPVKAMLGNLTPADVYFRRVMGAMDLREEIKQRTLELHWKDHARPEWVYTQA
jgi:hypothetical protein